MGRGKKPNPMYLRKNNSQRQMTDQLKICEMVSNTTNKKSKGEKCHPLCN